jgi:hypothetical protein
LSLTVNRRDEETAEWKGVELIYDVENVERKRMRPTTSCHVSLPYIAGHDDLARMARSELDDPLGFLESSCAHNDARRSSLE